MYSYSFRVLPSSSRSTIPRVVGFILRYVSKTVDELKNTSALLTRSVPQSTTEKVLIKPSDGRYTGA